jgi:hypothetical protein
MLYRLSDRRLSAKLVPTFADIFLDRIGYFFFEIALNFTHEAEWTPPQG